MKNKVKQGVFVNYTLHSTRKMDKKTKKELIDKHSPASTKFKNSCLAFLFSEITLILASPIKNSPPCIH
jgi:hypothetical protein